MILNPYVWLGGLLVVLLCLGSGYIYGRHDGVKITAAKYQAQQIESDRAAADALARSEQNATNIEHASQAAQLAASQTYQKELAHVAQTKDHTIAALRAGHIRLRDPGTLYSFGANPVSGTIASTGKCDGGQTGRLSDQLIEFFISESSRADAIVAQLSDCQAIIVSDHFAGVGKAIRP